MRPAFHILVLVSAFMPVVAQAAEQGDAPAQGGAQTKVCRLGGIETRIDAQEECLNTRAKCLARGGAWFGTARGRGREPGCFHVPTRDAGKKCVDYSQCESSCVSQDEKGQSCACYGWKFAFLNENRYICTRDGVVVMPHAN